MLTKTKVLSGNGTGWLAPNGDFYPCSYGSHIFGAEGICAELKIGDTDSNQSMNFGNMTLYGDSATLEGLGWIHCESRSQGCSLPDNERCERPWEPGGTCGDCPHLAKGMVDFICVTTSTHAQDNAITDWCLANKQEPPWKMYWENES
jgi:hypothetical protein